MHGYVIHKEPQILVLDVYLPFSKTLTQDMPHFLTTYTNSKGQPLPLQTNLHTDIMFLCQVLCSYFLGTTKWESHGEE
jgi:Golgi nucleoside diphosphatase